MDPNVPVTPYPSLNALRQANDELLAALPEEASDSAKTLPPNAEQIRNFILRAVETGALLDNAADRRATQGLIDYWTNNYPLLVSDAMSGRLGTRIKLFNDKAPAAAAADANAAIKGLGPKDKDLVRAILLHVVELPEGATRSAVTLVPIETLLALGDRQHVKDLIDQFVTAHVLRRVPGDGRDLIGLQYESLTRQWPLLRGWIEGRSKFRDAALFWKESGRNPGALLTAGLWDEAKAYGQLSKLEQEFIAASREAASKQEIKNIFYLGAALALLGVLATNGLLLAVYYFVNPYSSDQIVRQMQHRAQIPQGQDAQQGSSLARLASYTFMPTSASSFELTGMRFADLDFPGFQLYAPNFVKSQFKNVAFRGAKLRHSSFADSPGIINSHFEGADLEFTQFDNAIIKDSFFANADLYRAQFDEARLCNVDFTDSNLRGASFSTASIDDLTLGTLVKTAWWFAIWNPAQIKRLTGMYRSIDPASLKALKGFNEDKDEATIRFGRDRAFGLYAWASTLATWGIDLKGRNGPPDRDAFCRAAQDVTTMPENALDAIEQAICLAKEKSDKTVELPPLTAGNLNTIVERSNNESGVPPQFLATRGYILLQQEQAELQRTLQLSLAVKDLTRALDSISSPTSNDGYVKFWWVTARYLLAKDPIAKQVDSVTSHEKESDAISALSDVFRAPWDYTPSYELMQLDSSLHDSEFLKVVYEQMAKRRPAPQFAGGNCPTDNQ